MRSQIRSRKLPWELGSACHVDNEVGRKAEFAPHGSSRALLGIEVVETAIDVANIFPVTDVCSLLCPRSFVGTTRLHSIARKLVRTQAGVTLAFSA